MVGTGVRSDCFGVRLAFFTSQRAGIGICVCRY